MRRSVTKAWRLRAYRESVSTEHERLLRSKQLQEAVFEIYGFKNRCLVCGRWLEGSKSKGWYKELIDVFGREKVRQAFGKSGKRGKQDGLSFSLSIVDGEPFNIPTCSEGCRSLSLRLYEEQKEWLQQRYLWLSQAKKQLKAISLYLKTGDPKHCQSLPRALGPAEISLL